MNNYNRIFIPVDYDVLPMYKCPNFVFFFQFNSADLFLCHESIEKKKERFGVQGKAQLITVITSHIENYKFVLVPPYAKHYPDSSF